jgi:hypothetical protein
VRNKTTKGKEKMKMMISLLGILTALCFTGCIVERREPARTVVVAQPPPPVAVYEVPYDDPGRGWYIEGYYGPNHIWIAPFWTVDIELVHGHFDHYRGGHRRNFEEHFKQHPGKSDDRGRDNQGGDNRGRGRN